MKKWLAAVAAASAGFAVLAAEPASNDASKAKTASLPTVEEARRQAELLHDAIDSTLDIVHHQFYREDEGLPIPAASLKDVFAEIQRRRNVRLRWLAVDAQPMNTDHKPATDFEKGAVRKIANGSKAVEQAEGGLYQRVTPIKLGSECLKCHLPSRTSTEDRIAALIVSMKVRKK